MSSEPLLSSIIPFADSGPLRYTIGFALKKGLEVEVSMYANYHRLHGWNVLCWCSTVAKGI
jgi:hypothetical protein